MEILVILYSLKRNSYHRYRIELENKKLEEKINILRDQNAQESRNQVALKEKIGRYSSLKDIIEKINQSLILEEIADTLITVSFSLIANNRGVCILYLLDSQTHQPSLFKTKREEKTLIIKAKQGDIFDHWVLRHNSPLFIEDARKDFRFDLGKLNLQESRPIASLISAPLMSDHKIMGILRLDNTQAGVFSQDDLRFLVTICDLGGLALENSELFQKTQELAIHDGLTSLYNKAYFLERLKQECKRSLRKDISFSLLMLDIDYFKNCNDKFGHTAGDLVLKNLSQNIVEFLKPLNPIISRFGGEEFCIILPHTDKKKAYDIAEQLRWNIEKMKYLLRREEVGVTVSIGVAACPVDTCDEAELIFKSDQAMYEAKRKGRNRVAMS